ncbi:MAG: hypothetical protein ACW98F_03285 [Candidatus Hodarchaeales archaeon]|jgi:tetratricopeptide (TPR) repeat protein
MDLIKFLKAYSITLILLLLTILSFIIGFYDFDYVLPSYIMLGVFFGWLIYSAGFLTIHIANENAKEDKRSTQTYYSMKEWHSVDKKRDQIFIKTLMLITILVIVFILLFERLHQFPSLFTQKINDTIEFFVVNSWQIFAVLFILIYILVFILLFTRRLPEEMVNVFRGATNVVVFCLGFLIYVSVGIWFIVNEFLSIEAVMVGFFILPIALVINRVEGKFFYLFTINQWNQFRKYDILKGSQLQETSGLFKQLKALFTLLIIPISLISTFLGIIDVITGNLITEGEGGVLASLVDSILNNFPEFSALIIFLLTMGPLLILIVRPFTFVEVWLNQGLYEKMASPWDLDTLNDNMKKYSALFRIAHKTKGFRWSLFLSGASIMGLLGLNFISSFIIAESQMYAFIQDGLILVTFVTSIVFILTLIELSWDPIEEKTLLLFGRESRRSETDLINFSLYGELLLFETADMENYLNHNPESWGLPWFLKGLNLFYGDEERLKAFERALNDSTFLLKSITPIAWNDYGVLLTKSGRHEEALEAFMKGQKALGQKEEEDTEEIGTLTSDKLDMFPVANMMDEEPVSNMMLGEPVAQGVMKPPMYAQTETPMYAQMAETGGSDSSSDTPPERKGRLLSYDELVGADNKEGLVSLLDQRYNRRARSKITRNIAYLRQLRADLESNWNTVKKLNDYLESNPKDLEKWIELAELCEKMNFTDKAQVSYEKAAELSQSQGKEHIYEEVMKKLDKL